MGTIGKGLMLLVTRGDDPGAWPARVLSFLAIYSAIGLRDEAVNASLGQALQKNPFPPLQRLRRDAHEASDTCWLHVPGACLSLAARLRARQIHDQSSAAAMALPAVTVSALPPRSRVRSRASVSVRSMAARMAAPAFSSPR